MRTHSIHHVDASILPLTGAPGALGHEQNPALAGPAVAVCRRSFRHKLYALLLFLDIVSIFYCFAIGALVRFGDLHEQTWLRLGLAATPLFVGLAMHNGAYSDDALRSPSTSATRAVNALLGSFGLLLLISYFLKAEQDVSRLSVAVGALGAVVSVGTLRTLVGNVIQRNFSGRITSKIIITDETFHPAVGGAVVLNALSLGIDPASRDPDTLQRFAELVEGADRVIISCRRESWAKWATLLKGANVRGEILSDDVEALGALGVTKLGSRSTLVVASGPLSAAQQIVKRAFDVVVTGAALLFFSPLMIAIALAIKLDSPGPVLFRQKRVGFGNRMFEVYKFRSMAAELCDDNGNLSTQRGDARVTRVGHFIRRTSLDELPQLFNVLNGSMSLVGPRPHAVGSLAGVLPFWDVDDRYPHRHMLKPGITGLAQIRGHRGPTHEVDDLSRRLQSDLEYLNGWSIWRDLSILLKTVKVVVHQNAY